MSAATSRAAARTSPSGTTRFTRPMRSASAASRIRPVRTISLARPSPTMRGSLWVPPAPGRIPSPVSGWPSRADSPATRRSQARASSHPPPRAQPVTAATVGTRSASIREKSPWWTALAASSGVRSRSSAMSAPAANTFPPAPATTRAPAAGSLSRSARAACISSTILSPMAFFFPGRFRVSTATPSGPGGSYRISADPVMAPAPPSRTPPAPRAAGGPRGPRRGGGRSPRRGGACRPRRAAGPRTVRRGSPSWTRAGRGS